jgi:polar amino acid transport system substrate-binding protein
MRSEILPGLPRKAGACCAAMLALVLSPAPAAECARVVISGGSDYPPLHWYDGKTLTGASMEVAAMAFDALKIPYEIRYYGPFTRALKGAKDGEIDVLATLKNTEERRQFLAFAEPPVFTSPIAVFVARNRQFAYREWKDLIGKKGGVTRGYTYGDGFDEYLQQKLTVEAEQKTYINFDKLDAGRIDYLITGYYNGLAYLAQNRQLDRFTALRPYLTDSNNYIAFSRASPCIKYLKSFSRQLDIMLKSGLIKEILEKHTRLLLESR